MHAGLIVHLLLAILLLVIFPISKLVHAPGVAFAPTFNQRDPRRAASNTAAGGTPDAPTSIETGASAVDAKGTLASGTAGAPAGTPAGASAGAPAGATNPKTSS